MIYVRVAVAMLGAGALRAALHPVVSPEVLHIEVHGLAAYLEVVGGLYSIIVAFLIYVVWDQFNRVQTGMAREAAALEDLCRASTFFTDRESASRIRSAVKSYAKATASDEPGHLASGKASMVAHATFGTLGQAVRGAAVQTDKDQTAYAEVLGALRRVTDARDERLGVSTSRIPGTLWSMVVFGATLVVAGFLVLDLGWTPLSVAVAAAVAGILTFILSVVRDMDNPFVGVWKVSYTALTDAASRIA
jgi:Protein of unknown function (DUF4239)